ncbi:hypothetical protein HPP92_002525 [Vanilla planifolia]|uniref:UDP-N-acetylmuramate--L-alanine ligase n=1 Tax=Vanilla planifolia TaxID=51239 RepID=A0A835RYC2_VANPL|nr:hypothetical protein HPP92_002525 [Vanilla planifolia]
MAGHRRQLRYCRSERRGSWLGENVKEVAAFVRCAFVGGQSLVDGREVVAYSKRGEGKKVWVHFVGIGGSGLSALAMLAHKQGFEVSGSDIVWSSYMNDLHLAGVKVFLGHSIASMEVNNHGRLPDAVIISSAIPKDNIEVVYAESVGIPIYKRDSWLRYVTAYYNLIAIGGTHGKSTTAAMLSYVLHATGDDLIAVVGANVPQFSGGNIIPGNGPNFILEADEYDCCFLGLSPSVAVVTNVEWDHVDIFDDEEHVRCVFREFVQQIKCGGHLILCGDSAGAYSLLGDCKPNQSSTDIFPGSLISDVGYTVTTYGLSSKMDWYASCITPNSQGGQDYILHYRECPVADVSLKLPGVHNVLNSLAVVATIATLIKNRELVHETIDSVKHHLSKFEGVSRRFELIGKLHGCCIYDDYAHHPTEVRATLQAARQKFPSQPLWVVFQPHTFSRIAALMEDFVTAFTDADHLIVTEIYAAREENKWNSDGKDLANLVIGPASEYIPNLDDVVDKLLLELSTNRNQETIVMTLGAGDITTLGPKLLNRMQTIP